MIASVAPGCYTLPFPPCSTPPSSRWCGSMIEELESRELLSVSAPLSVPTNLIGPALATHSPLHHVNANDVQTVLPLKISSLSLQNGQLIASGTLAGQSFSTLATLAVDNPAIATAAATTVVPAATVPILHLTLNPIHLDLLGLNVDTSAICLKIDANTSPGNLLGNLLAGVANLLNGGTPLGTILGNLGSDLNTVLGGLTGLLNGVLGNLTAPTSLAGVSQSAAAPAVNILNLSLGPVDLNLLGLAVHVDNCANGPVTVAITAQPGPGNLLGNLLGGLGNLLNSNANQQGILSNLANVSDQILTML